jgi:ankyrin repeat protein
MNTSISDPILEVALPYYAGSHSVSARCDCLGVLIMRGIDLDAQDNEKRTALFFAATYQNRVVAEALINAGADILFQKTLTENLAWILQGRIIFRCFWIFLENM